MKVSVRVNVTYYYTMDIQDDTAAADIVEIADTDDPVYKDISRILNSNPKVDDYDAYTTSIVNDETGDYLYEY